MATWTFFVVGTELGARKYIKTEPQIKPHIWSKMRRWIVTEEIAFPRRKLG